MVAWDNHDERLADKSHSWSKHQHDLTYEIEVIDWPIVHISNRVRINDKIIPRFFHFNTASENKKANK